MKPGMLRWLLVVLLLAPAAGGAATIRGTLRVGRPAPAIRPASAGRPMLPPSMLHQVREAVIYLEEAPEKVEKKLAEGKTPQPVVGEFEHGFIPRVTPVAAGTRVRFENQDRVYHNVFSVSPAKSFDLGKYAPREAREVTFDRPGLVKLYNDLDPGMTGFVLVLPHHAFTRPDSTGAWSFPKLPRGTYKLRVWHPALGKLSRRVEMPRRGDATLDLSY